MRTTQALIRSAIADDDYELAELIAGRLASSTLARARRGDSLPAERIIRSICHEHGLPYRSRR
jgi:hypothetical protein